MHGQANQQADASTHSKMFDSIVCNRKLMDGRVSCAGVIGREERLLLWRSRSGIKDPRAGLAGPAQSPPPPVLSVLPSDDGVYSQSNLQRRDSSLHHEARRSVSYLSSSNRPGSCP